MQDTHDAICIGPYGRGEGFEIVRGTGESVARGIFHSPGRLEGGAMVFYADQDLDDGEYVARVRDDTKTGWVINARRGGVAMDGSDHIRAPLPPHRLTFTVEGSAPPHVDPPLPYDDDPYKPSLW